ncbi:MAG: HEAT repeat domain-containing protein [Spirochaetes bacterium]|nr:HEAT repeat domain-containing protein [Spirochaetota bacterium]
MRALPRIARTTAPVLLAAVLAVLLASCATISVRDDLPPGAEKGWVVFVSDDRLALSISRISNGSEGEIFSDRTSRGTLVATACPPGRNDFAVRDRDNASRVRVPVAEGMVTYVGVRMQVISEEPTTTYDIRMSVGTHPLPFDPRAKNPAPLVTALVDNDWATRWAAVKALERISPPLEPAATPLLISMAREDAYEQVRAAAQSVLQSVGKPAPAKPLVFMSFEQSADGWPLGEGLASVTSLVPEGYLLEGTVSKGTAWRARSMGNALVDREDLDFLLECRWLSGNEATAYGLTLGSGPGTFNAFCVSREGGVIATRFTDGRYRSAHMPWKTSAAAAITGTTVTRFEVLKRGARYEVVVNGEEVGGFTDEIRLAVTHVGVFVDDLQSVVFRKIVVTVP